MTSMVVGKFSGFRHNVRNKMACIFFMMRDILNLWMIMEIHVRQVILEGLFLLILRIMLFQSYVMLMVI
ncbi:hypothetical protein DRJ54_07215 [Candidatus Acetothermia bacterium]|nr:MAG: hypothetical protein DRJ54_07215 [Candidatus Acetothermia bacterium]